MSFMAVLENYIESLGDKLDSLYISASEELSQRLLNYVRKFMDMDGIRGKALEDNARQIILPNGSVIESLPSTSNTTRSRTADRLILDEFAHWRNDKEVFQAIAHSMTRSDKLRKLTIISTPMGKRGMFYDLWDNPKTYYRYTRHRIDINDAIKGGCPIDIDTCRSLVPDDIAFRQEYMCDFIDEATSYFPYELIQQCWNAEALNYTIEQLRACKYPLYAGYDPAKVVDSGVFTIVERTPTKVYVRYRKVWKGARYAEQIAHIEHYCKIASVTKLITDQTGVGQKIQEDLCNVNRLGSRAEGMTFTNASKEKMITDLRVLFQDMGIEIPYDMELVNELHSLQRIVGDTGVIRYKHEEGKHDDSVWSLAMACYGFTMFPKIEIPKFSPMVLKQSNYVSGRNSYGTSVY